MSVPKSVEEAAELAEELHARMFQTEEPSNEEDITDGVNTNTEVDEENEEDAPIDPTDIKELAKFRDRYMSLKGKYDAEVPRLAAELRELRESLTKPKVEAPVEEEPEDDIMSTVSEEYGEDFINAIRKVIQHEVKPIIKPVQEQTQNVVDTQQEAAKESFKSYLDTKVEKGNWRELWEGKDTGFVEFMKQPDPSGLYTYGDLIEMYNENWDGDRLAKVFDTYFDTKKPVENKPTRNPQKDALIAPSRQNNQPAPNAEGKEIWTMDKFEDFKRNDRMGKYSPEESERLWADVASAPAEGRMR